LVKKLQAHAIYSTPYYL